MTYLLNSLYSDSPNACIVLEDGSVFYGYGFGACGQRVGEVCFNTSMTGYQEIISDPSYAGQIINFTFPHIGNTGTNDEDWERSTIHARGIITNQPPSEPSNWRATESFDEWMKRRNLVGIWGIDTRQMTQTIRDKGAMKACIVYLRDGENFDLYRYNHAVNEWPGLKGLDLAKTVTCDTIQEWDAPLWNDAQNQSNDNQSYHVVAIDYGAKDNILRHLTSQGFKVTLVPATTTSQDILALNPDGVFLSNGPGDPAATGEYAIDVITDIINASLPVFGICLGHQLLALSFGCKTTKMHLGHRGGNHPVKNLETGLVEITSQNHGFMVDRNTILADVVETHISLFDNTNEGIAHKTLPAFSVQYHPEASPGPHDSAYLFKQFKTMIEHNQKAQNTLKKKAS